ncbi:MAG: bacillithiol biosynthesis deacetylase BshB1 [Arenicella sp.]|jgi:bacillithiol biosynthesis deacetylase BshB1
MKLDILALAAHPDDIELSCSGTLIRHAEAGKKVGIVDFTQGELGTRGTPELRLQEAEEAGKRMRLSARVNLGFADGFFKNDLEHQMELIKQIRKYKPEIVFANALTDRHPDHGRAARLSIEACFLSGLKKVATELDGEAQEAWRPKKIFHYIQSTYIEPDFVVDVTEQWKKKTLAIEAFESQFHVKESGSLGDQTFISTPEFMQFISSRARSWGQSVGVKYAEGFTTHQALGLNNLFDLI